MIYLIRCKATGLTKIGTAVSPERRLRYLQTGSASELELVGTVAGERTDEVVLHRRFADRRRRGEWFALSEIDIEATLAGRTPEPSSAPVPPQARPCPPPMQVTPAASAALDRFREKPTSERGWRLVRAMGAALVPPDTVLRDLRPADAREARALDLVRRHLAAAQHHETAVSFYAAAKLRRLGCGSLGLLVVMLVRGS